jgi:3-oxoacyl-[acyl-carrier protein] reductase
MTHVDMLDSARPVAIVTGVGRPVGIGAGIATRLAADGWDLALSYWTPADEEIFGSAASDGLDEVIAACESAGARVLATPANLESPDAAAAIVAHTNEVFGPATALVLSHAWDIDSSILDTSVAEFDRHFVINTRASWQLIAEFARQLPPREAEATINHGRIVALTSDHTAHNLPYGASKGALDRIVIAAAKELAHLGISSNALNPGPIDTGWMTEEVRETLTAMQPSGRLGTPKDVADLVSFLLSPGGGWVTGQLLTTNGGFAL